MAQLTLALMCLGASSALAQLSDEVALIHMGVQSHGHRRASEGKLLLLGPMELLAQVTKMTPAKPTPRFNCTEHGSFCQAPFNCQYEDLAGNPASSFKPVAKSGHANPKSFCVLPKYFRYIKYCLVHRNLKKAAQIHYQSELKAGGNEVEGSICFSEGHCTNKAVHENTTLEETEKMCDERFGHAGWAQWSPAMDVGLMRVMNPFVQSAIPKSGLHDRHITRYFTKLACAMGSYHCDIMTCKETYCKNEYYIKKYKSLQPVTPGHYLRQLIEPF